MKTRILTLIALFFCSSLALEARADTDISKDWFRCRKVAEWSALLGGKDSLTVLEALKALELYGSEARSEAAKIRAVLGSTIAGVPVSAAKALVAAGVGDEKVAGVLISALEKSKRPNSRRALMEALGKLGVAASKAVPVLLEKLDKESLELQTTAAQSLSHLGKVALPAVVEALEDSKQKQRFRFVIILGEMGSQGRGAIPALLKTLQEDDVMMRATSARALGSVGHGEESVVEALKKAEKDKDAMVSELATESLKILATKPKSKWGD